MLLQSFTFPGSQVALGNVLAEAVLLPIPSEPERLAIFQPFRLELQGLLRPAKNQERDAYRWKNKHVKKLPNTSGFVASSKCP